MRKIKNIIKTGAVLGVLSISSMCFADNPIVQTIYTSDPAPMIYKDTLYVYTGHDEDNSTYFTMNDWRCYSTTDMQNWTDLGSPLAYTDFSWAKGDAWAAQCIERNGKFYMYVPLAAQSGGTAIGVAVADHPAGPFKDALGKPLIAAGYGNIDPTVYIDTDGQAYLYWGNPQLYYVKLNSNMTSYSGSINKVPLTTAAFGKRDNHETRETLYEEAPWFYKRNGLYYMLFAANLPEFISYSTSTSPTGPWTYRGVIMPTEGKSFTNHPGVVDYKGNSYFFYHNGALPGGSGFTRSVAVEEFKYNPDGSIPTIKMTTQGPKQIQYLNPYVRNEAETICWSSGVETEKCSEGGMNVGFIDNNDYIKVKGVDFGTGARAFEARVASANNGGNIEIRIDSIDGRIIGTCKVEKTGGWQEWVTKTCDVSNVTGVHDLYFKYTGGSGSLFNINWWKFTSAPGETPSEDTVKPITNYATLKEGWYYIKNTGSQKYLQVTGDQGGNAVNVEIAQGKGTVGQKWYLTNVGDGYITLKNGHNYMLDVERGLNEDKTNIQVYTGNGLAAQQFKLLPTSQENVYGIVTKASTDTRGLDVADKGITDGSNVQQYFYYGGSNQTWILETCAAPGESEVPGVPEVPEIPEIPETPEVPETPQIGDMVRVKIVSDWTDGATAEVTVTNLTGKALSGWICTFTTNRAITSLWSAKLVSQNGNTYTISNPDWKPDLAAGESYTFGCNMGSGSSNVTVSNVSLK